MKQRVLLKGKDGIDLLHRISTIDLKHPKLNEKTTGLILNPQGKIRSLFVITVKSLEEAEIEFEDEFLSIVDEITFGERYEFAPLPLSETSELDEEKRISEMKAKEGFEFKPNGETNPLEVNLRSAIHDQKGCYPGQEVIEKVISLGSPARKLCLVEGVVSNLVLPAPLKNMEGVEAGVLTSFAGSQGLAILKRTFLKANETLFVGSGDDISALTVKRISDV